ncbi:uncharacterized protein IL334_007133 [Kwoniella shivajii]|uniref:SGNH hydrolase-type esterase domain-containing protein n=1 Tax=Kwoniella shivajii TaxID=564305 RepID=A0ABZ1D9P2_9TREE|nr:hypothetical protein IL334_007133 [Kwoniella shivajii]
MAKAIQDCIVLFGDSLTERQDVPQALFERMNNAYGRKLDVLNRGFGGYTSTLVLPLFEHLFTQKPEISPQIRLITMWFGTNDGVNFPNPRATTPLQFKKNHELMLENLTSPRSSYAVSDAPVHILLITPPPPYLPQVPLPAQWVRSTERCLEFTDVIRDLGKEWKRKEESIENKSGWKIEVLDLWKAMEDRAGGIGDGLAPFFHDGCHMTTEGYGVLWDEYQKIVKGAWKGDGLDWEDEDDLPLRVPSVREVNVVRPENVVEKMGVPKWKR